MRRRVILTTVVALVAALAPIAPPLVQGAGGCPAAIAPSGFATADELRAANQVMADLGPRPTASAAHEAFVAWIEERLDGIEGITRSALGETIDRQIETGAALTVDGAEVPVAGAVPYTRAGSVTAPVVRVPDATPITAANAAGSIVVRDATPGSIPFLLFLAVAYYLHDPDLTFDLLGGTYERDWVGAGQRAVDLESAERAGAAGVVFVHGLPREQVEGQYAPYTGDHWELPGVYLGVDEGRALLDQVRAGPVTATISVEATTEQASTRTVVATLPGRSPERIVVQSHTDGMNAVWDNGPIAMLALAEHFAGVPLACRPRTIEFVFTTAHLNLAHSGAERYAELLDDQYEDGTVAFVVALEHLGAREFAAVPRGDGPGRRLEPTGRDEILASFVSESPFLALELIEQVVRHDLRRTLVLRGADTPQLALPPHRSYGGEGGPYRTHLVPTVAAITGPWTLFNPAFGMDELVDFGLMRRQTLAFGDLIHGVDDVPRTLLAGADLLYRAGRDLVGSNPLPLPGLPGLPPPALGPGAPPDPAGLLPGLLDGVAGLAGPVAPPGSLPQPGRPVLGSLSASLFCTLLT